MSEWWTYRASDFLMFSPDIYWRLFATLNGRFWPLQPLLAAAVLLWLGLLARRRFGGAERFGRIGATGFAICWLLTSWAFLHRGLAPIYWVAEHFAIAFAVQAALLATLAISGIGVACDSPLRRRVGLALMLWAVIGQPLLDIASGRPLPLAQFFGLAADPTAIGTLALLLLSSAAQGWRRWLLGALWTVPLAWCVASGAMYWTMGAAQGWVMLAAATGAVGALVTGRKIDRSG